MNGKEDNWQAIFWDFDGVLMESNDIRSQGFEKVLKDFPEEQVESLLSYHQSNGGLSRYVKFRYFFEKVRGESISEEKIREWAKKFSLVMVSQLNNPSLLIEETLNYVRRNFKETPMHIVSGSDGEELRYLCRELKIHYFFKSIHGSPTPKSKLVRNILIQENYQSSQCLLVGDSINDFEAAEENNVFFMAYNNPKLLIHQTAKLTLLS